MVPIVNFFPIAQLGLRCKECKRFKRFKCLIGLNGSDLKWDAGVGGVGFKIHP